MSDDLIRDHVTRLRHTLKWRTGLKDVCAEVEDHLREHADRLSQ